MNEPKLFLPTVPATAGDMTQRPCLICGGEPGDGLEIVNPNGMVSMSVDDDLCLECAVWLWRAFKSQGGPDTRTMVLALLSAYGPTSKAAARFWAKQIRKSGASIQ